MTLTQAVKTKALELGFSAVGITSSGSILRRRQELVLWQKSGFAGEMEYMRRFLERQERLLENLPDLKGIVVLAVPYASSHLAAEDSRVQGRIARYAWGRDYHRVIRKPVRQLENFIRQQAGPSARTMHSIDKGPVQERVLAEAAGLGFFGKNTCLIRPRGGSFFFLAALLTNLELTPDEPIRWDCGSCTLCIKACPTQALVRPYELDARRCISYLTIESSDAIPLETRPLVGDWLFGCDLCQEVCPYNHQPDPPQPWPAFKPKDGAGESLPVEEILNCRSEEEFENRFWGRSFTRAGRSGLLRNAAVVSGNLKRTALTPALIKTLQEDSDPVVRSHAAWALGELAVPAGRSALEKALETEKIPSVIREIRKALSTP